MPLPPVESEDEKFYWQALGVLKGTLLKDKPAIHKNDQYSILYRGREYPVFPSRRRFEQRKNFDLNKERLYLVYPVPKAKKPIHLIREDYGIKKSQAIALLPNGIRQLFDVDPYAKKLLRKQIGLMKAGVLEELFTTSKAKPTPQDESFANAIFNVLKEMFLDQNKDFITGQGSRIASSLIGLLNYGCCNQLYSPETPCPERAFLGTFFRSLKASKEQKRSGIMLDTLSFALVGFSDGYGDMYLSKEGKPLEQELISGEFLLSGEWKPWKKDRTKASFTSRLNENTDRDLSITPIGCEKKKKLTIFLDREDPQLKEKCYGKAIVDFIAPLNTFALLEFQPCEEMHPALTSKTLATLRKRKARKRRRARKRAEAARNNKAATRLNEDLRAEDNFNAVKNTDTIDQFGSRGREVRNQGLLDDKTTEA